MVASKVRHGAAFGLGCWELLFYGGIIYGWALLVYVLQAEGYYSHLCENKLNETNFDGLQTTNNNLSSVVSCEDQEAKLRLVFTIGVFSLQGSIFFFGMLFDYFGTMIVRLILQ